MYLENLVFDAVDPQRLGRFWQAALGTTMLTDGPDGFETRLHTPDGPNLDLCFQPVAEPSTRAPRVQLDLRGGATPDAVVEHLVGLGATRQGPAADGARAVVLADPEGYPFRVVGEHGAHPDTGPLAAVTIRGSDPVREAAFWADLSGWAAAEAGDAGPSSLRHPSGHGPVLQFQTEDEPKQGKNRLHLDLRLESGDEQGEVLEHALAMGATRLVHDWGDLPWIPLTDPAGNELCLLPEHAS
ncbi:VOC family protein [Nostocoides sp. HKS02]|uniref:VOC family protein n=1 Tax=Nostocoides sp. HKS02 TaxID=1813880 RepID=UPI0012B49DC6|nr:VOC family protein [Tetrasphaera sp. HKS02]QGN57082.1 VOC family protein [Tetrasphaera sp. HKS02]